MLVKFTMLQLYHKQSREGNNTNMYNDDRGEGITPTQFANHLLTLANF